MARGPAVAAPYGLSTAFFHAAALLKLRYSRRGLAQLLQNHEEPESLLALLELAPSCGLQAEAFEIGLEDLRLVEAPAILYVTFEEVPGFLTLIASQESGDFSFASKDGRSVRLDPRELGEVWSGIVILLEEAENPGESERGYRWNLFLEWAFGRVDSLKALAGRGVGNESRVAALVALGFSLLIQGVRGAEEGFLRAVVLFLLLLALAGGTWLSAALFRLSRGGQEAERPLLAERLCGQSGDARGAVDCDSVLHSRFATVGPFTLSSLGLVGFVAAWLALACVPLLSSAPGATHRAIGGLFLLWSPLSLFLIGVQAWPLRKLCPLCLGVHGLILSGAALAWWRWIPGDPSEIGRFLMLWLLCSVLSMGFGIPWALLGERVQALMGTLSQATSTPLGSLALTLARPQMTAREGDSSPVVLMSWGSARAPVRIEAFLNPQCQSCGPVLEGVLALQEDFREQLRLEIHLAPKSGQRQQADINLCVAMYALALAAGKEKALDAFRRVKADTKTWKEVSEQGPRQLVERLSPEESQAVEALKSATEALEESAAAVKKLRLGLPIVLVGGRLFDGPLDHLRVLLGEHASLVIEGLTTETQPLGMS